MVILCNRHLEGVCTKRAWRVAEGELQMSKVRRVSLKLETWVVRQAGVAVMDSANLFSLNVVALELATLSNT